MSSSGARPAAGRGTCTTPRRTRGFSTRPLGRSAISWARSRRHITFAAPSRTHTPADDIIDNLRELLDLPDLWGPVPLNEVTLQRGDLAAARLASRIATREIGATGLALLSDGWSAMRAHGGPGAQARLTMAVAAASPRRRSTVLALWRGDGDAAGFKLWRGTDLVSKGRWNTGWHYLEDDDRQAQDADAQAFAEQAGDREIDMASLRALLRARTRSSDPLAELTALLGVPAEALDVLDERADAPPLELLEPAGLVRLVWEEVKDTEAGPWISARWLQITIAVLATVIAVGAAGAAAVGYAVLATDGAFVDQTGVSAGDWVFTVVVTLAVPMNLWCAVQLIRRGTFL